MALAMLHALPAHGALAYWDTNGAVSGAGAVPVGTWGVDPFWSTSPSGTASTGPWVSGNSAVFSAGSDATGSFTVTVSDTQTVEGILLEEGNLTLAGGTLAMTGGAINVLVGRTASIASTISGSSGVAKGGDGTLVLSGNNTFSGEVGLHGGTLRINEPSGLGVGTAAVVVSGATLEIVQNAELTRPMSLEQSASLRTFDEITTFKGGVNVGAGALVTLTAAAANSELHVGSPTGLPNVPSLSGGTGGANVVVNGPGRVRLWQTVDYAGSWTVTAGILDPGTDARLGPHSNPVILAGGTISFDGGGTPLRPFIANGGGIHVDNGALTLAGSLTSGAGGGFSKSGDGVLRVFSSQSYGAGATLNVNSGDLYVFTAAGNASVYNLTVNVNAGRFRILEHDKEFLKGLHVADGAVADFTPAGTGVLQVDNLSVTGSGKLDLTSNKLIVKNAAGNVGSWNGSAYTGITGLIQSGRNEGTWDGGGIITSRQDALTEYTTLAIATADELGRVGETFGGVTVSSGDVLVAYTYGGDANLDGMINIDDYGQIDFNVGLSGVVFGYFNGDFNYDGLIKIDDYGMIDFTVGIQGPPIAMSGMATAVVASSAGEATTPEPGFPALLCLAGTPLLLRRARRSWP